VLAFLQVVPGLRKKSRGVAMKTSILVFIAFMLLSLVCYVSSAYADLIFQDTFEDGNANGWMAKNASNWRVIQDQGDFAYNLWNPGTSVTGQTLQEWSILAGQQMDDFMFSCKIRVAANLTENPRAGCALIFRYQNANNYYFIIINAAANQTKLMKRLGGIDIELAQNDRQIIKDNMYHQLQIDAAGEQVIVRFDDAQILSIEDNSILSGAIGLAAIDFPAFFDDIALERYGPPTQSLTIVDSLQTPGPDPTGLAWDGNRLWYADGESESILQLDASGNTLSRMAVSGGKALGLLWMSPGYMFQSAPRQRKYYKLDVQTGAVLSSFESPGGRPWAIVWDGANFWLTDVNRKEIYKYDMNGNAVATILGPGQSHVGMAWDGIYLWVLQANKYLYKMTRTGQVIDVFDPPGSNPRGLCFDGQYLWLSDASRNKIYKISTSAQSRLDVIYSQIDATQFPIIHSYLSVVTPGGQIIQGLTGADFAVQENSISVPFTLSSMCGDIVPISVALVMDRSGSMADYNRLTNAQLAATTFVGQLGANDKAALISFSTSSRVDQSFTSNKPLINTALMAMRAEGNTAIYNACRDAINHSNSQTGRKAIILLSDGGDNSSTISEVDVTNEAVRYNTPIFTIGLGISEGSGEEQILKSLALKTGGRYYSAPDASRLAEIYQLLSQQLQCQYRVSYVSPNQNFDGSIRNVAIGCRYQGFLSQQFKYYQAPNSGGAKPNLAAVAGSPQSIGNTFWLELQISSVTDLFGLSFELSLAPGIYIHAIPPSSSSMVAGDFWMVPSDLVFYGEANESAGIMAVGMSRKSGQSGISGSGTVFKALLQITASAPIGTNILCQLDKVTAINSSGAPLMLSTSSCQIRVAAPSCSVWPGDTNNNQTVDQADVLPLGLYWSRTGPVRANASNNWIGQTCQPWTPESSTYADANGDGIVNQADILPIGFNWAKSHALHKIIAASVAGRTSASMLRLSSDRLTYAADSVFTVSISIEDVDDLLGISFELWTDKPEFLSLDSLIIDPWFGTDIISYLHKDTQAGKIAIGISRKFVQGGISGSGNLFTIKAHVIPHSTLGSSISLGIRSLEANDSQALPILISTEPLYLTVGHPAWTMENHAALPQLFEVEQNFPNPFNAETVIHFTLDQSGNVVASIYNVFGQRVKMLINGILQQGSYTITWDGTTSFGKVPSGTYLLKVQSESGSRVIKMIYVP
jgi:VWFA-related protein